MEITITLTVEEFHAIGAYAEFTYKYPEEASPCNQCGKSSYGRPGCECYGCTREEHFKDEKHALFSETPSLTPELIKNVYVKEYIKAYHEKIKADEEAERALAKVDEANSNLDATGNRFTIVAPVTVTQKTTIVEG